MSKIIRTSIAAAMVFGAVSSAHAANWVDDWFDAAVTTQPGVFESQQRSYATLGGFQGRIKTHTDSLMTISPPRINAGCGGIDIFMGGFSFLNPDYLVEKAEKMLRVAPYIAFDIALNELCTTCSMIKDRAEQISNFLNNLQLDECKAAKPLALAMTTPFRDDGVTLSSIGSSLKTGAENMWNDAKKAFAEDPAKGVKEATNNSDMSSEGKSALLTEGPLLTTIGTKLGMTTTRVAQMRALIGDVVVTYSGTYSFKPDPQCPDATYSALIDKTPYTKTAGGVCKNESGSSLKVYVSDQIDGIASKILTNKASSYSTLEKDFISRCPLPVIYILNTASKYGDAQLNEAAARLKPAATEAYAFNIFIELVRNVSDALTAYQKYLASCTGDDELSATHQKSIKDLINKAMAVRDEAYQAYNAKAGELTVLSNMLAGYQRQQEVIESIISDDKYAMGREF